MFVMIGIGMACGLGAVPMAVVATMFVSGVLALFDAGHRARPRMARVAISVSDPTAAYERIRIAFPTARVVELPNGHPRTGTAGDGRGAGETCDAATVMRCCTPGRCRACAA